MLLQKSVFIATSLDGFIASVDVLVMGRRTYEKVRSFGVWPYGDTPVIVLSRKEIAIPNDLARTVSWSGESPAVLCDRLASEGKQRAYIDGGVTIQRFLAACLREQLLDGVGFEQFAGGLDFAVHDQCGRRCHAERHDLGDVGDLDELELDAEFSRSRLGVLGELGALGTAGAQYL